MLFSRLMVRRIRLGSGLLLLLFVAGHLSNLGLGLVSVDAMERSRGALLAPWQTKFGQALLVAAAIVHAGLGLASLASRHSLAMSRTDWVQLLLGVATPPLLLNHVVGLQVTSDLVARFNADYGYVLAVYWRYAPLFALQQLLVVVIVWAHGAIGLYSTLVLTRAWPRVAPIVVPMLFAIPILALLGFAHAGEAVLARLASDTAWRALIEQNLQLRQTIGHRLNVVEGGVFLVYGAAVALAVGVLVANILRRRRMPVTVSYDGGLTAMDVSECRCSRSAERMTFLMRVSAGAAAVARRAGSSWPPMPISTRRPKRSWRPSTEWRRRQTRGSPARPTCSEGG
jgi:adenylate cyclase